MCFWGTHSSVPSTLTCIITPTYTGLPPLTRYDTTSASNIGVYLSSTKPSQKNKIDKQKRKKHIIKRINTNFLFGITERLGTGRRPGPASAVKPDGIPVGYVISTDTLQQEFSPQNWLNFQKIQKPTWSGRWRAFKIDPFCLHCDFVSTWTWLGGLWRFCWDLQCILPKTRFLVVFTLK